MTCHLFCSLIAWMAVGVLRCNLNSKYNRWMVLRNSFSRVNPTSMQNYWTRCINALRFLRCQFKLMTPAFRESWFIHERKYKHIPHSRQYIQREKKKKQELCFLIASSLHVHQYRCTAHIIPCGFNVRTWDELQIRSSERLHACTDSFVILHRHRRIGNDRMENRSIFRLIAYY